MSVCSGSALTAIGPALSDPGHIYNTVGEALSRSSNFFINYITVQVATQPMMFSNWLFRSVDAHIREGSVDAN